MEPLRKKDGSSYYWYYTEQEYDTIAVKKSRTDCYNYSHYKGNSYDGNKMMKTIYMPVKEQLTSELNKTEHTHYEVPSPVSYKRTAAHEMGHVLGLDDAYGYKVKDAVGNKIEINRISDEIQKNHMIMKNGKAYDKIQ